MTVLSVATCQFPVAASIDSNLRWIMRQMTIAAEQGARVAHFPEAALSGYAGVDFATFAGFGWARLDAATERIREHARNLGIWSVVGSAQRFSDSSKPHNSLYVIDDDGVVVARYDKRFCAGDATGQTGDLANYSPGDHGTTWSIDGIRCGALICYDYRFPELYRQYAADDVQVVFHSFHAGNVTPQRLAAIGAAIGPELAAVNPAATHTYPGITMPATMTAAAASNFVWISCPNSSARESLWPAFFVRADGVTTGRLRRNVAGVLVSVVDTGQDLYDSTGPWRHRAMSGILHSGTTPEEDCQ